MKSVRVLWVGAAVVVPGLCALYAAGARSEQDRAPSATAPAEKVAERPVDRGATRDASADEVLALRQELRQLRAEMTAARQQSASKGSAPAERPLPDVRRDPIARAEAEAARQAQIDEIESSFRTEPSDPKWASDTSSSIRDALGSAQIAQNDLRNVECRSHTCRVEFVNDGSNSFNKSLPILANRLGQTLPSVVANSVDEGNGTLRTVLYLSRSP